MIQADEFMARLQKAIDDNTITLPTLPEVALRVRDAAEQENTTAKEIAEIIVTDAAISARLLQVANSPLYRPRTPIDNVQMAVTRLGTKLVRSLVTSLAMKQIFQPTSDVLETRLRQVWEDSVQTAAIAKVLAQTLPQIENEQAMLSGLVHNIGTLPILAMAEDMPELLEHPDHLDKLVDELYPKVGELILKSWGFPEDMVRVPAEHRDLMRDPGPEADDVDVVMVARLQHLAGTNHPDALVDWTTVPAFTKVGLEPEILVVEVEDIAEDVQAARAALEV